MNETLALFASNFSIGTQLQQNCTVIESQVVDNLGKIPKIAFWLSAIMAFLFMVSFFWKEESKSWPVMKAILLQGSMIVVWIDALFLLPLTYHVSEELIQTLTYVLFVIVFIGIVYAVWSRRRKAQ